MIVGSLNEDLNKEKRVAITPEVVKKYKSLGLEIYLAKDYATHLGISDQEYKSEGANISNNIDDVISKSNAILQMNIPDKKVIDKINKDQILIGVLNPHNNLEKLSILKKKNVSCFSL